MNRPGTDRPRGRGGRGGRGPGKPRGPRAGSDKKPHEPALELHPTLDPPDVRSFREWELGDAVQDVVAAMGIEVPTPIQRLAIQAVLDGRDVIAKAETGTGKTLAFGAPMMARMDPGRSTVLGLVLCPTRELAQQVADVLEKLGEPTGVRVALVVGGDPMHPQVAALQAGAQVVVGTPGRVLDLMRQKFLSFPWTEFVVLDEADEMLEIGFLPDVQEILRHTPDERQTLLFSATFPAELLRLARDNTRDPAEVATAKGVATVERIEQRFIEVEEDDKPLALMRLIEQSADDDVLLVFCERRLDVDRLMRRLERIRFPIKALHGGYDQASRFRVMSAFRTREVKALVATDVAARGLDVAHVSIVVNYDVPREVTDYTHRIGRTGRAGREGLAITLISPRDRRRWRDVLGGMTWAVSPMDLPERGSRQRRGRDESEEREEPRAADEGRERAPRRERERGEKRREEPRRRDPRGRRDEEPRSAEPRAVEPRAVEERPREAGGGFGAGLQPPPPAKRPPARAPSDESAEQEDAGRPKRRRGGRGRGRDDRGASERGGESPNGRGQAERERPKEPRRERGRGEDEAKAEAATQRAERSRAPGERGRPREDRRDAEQPPPRPRGDGFGAGL